MSSRDSNIAERIRWAREQAQFDLVEMRNRLQYRGEFVFPVPLDDISDATLELEDKTILFMRYIRRALNEGSFVRRVDH